MGKRISVVLPTYNRSKYLPKSIDSILSQTFSDFELIIVDDCSSDDTEKIAREYELKDSRITVIRNDVNRKLPASLNIGFAKASGDYLTWTSDDNMYKPDAFRIMLSYLERHQVPLVCADMEIIDEKDTKANTEFMKDYHFDESKIYFENIVRGCFLYKHDILERVGFYNENLFGLEDYEYWVRIYKEYGKIGYIDECLYQYRIHSESLTETRKDNINKIAHNFRMTNLKYLIENRIKNPYAITTLFCELLFENREEGYRLYRRVCELVPEMEIINLKPDRYAKYIVYGAGNNGKRIADALGDSVLFFADRSPEKWGMNIEGKRVLDMDEFIALANGYEVCVALSYEKVYEAIKELSGKNIRNFTLCYLMSEFKNDSVK